MPNYDYKVTCDVCGFVHMRSRMKKRWDGLLVCPEDWELRHVNDFPPPIPKHEGQGVPDARPQDPTLDATIPQTNPDNFLKHKIWGSCGQAIWGGRGDPTKWGNS